jgi:hypothetical protein
MLSYDFVVAMKRSPLTAIFLVCLCLPDVRLAPVGRLAHATFAKEFVRSGCYVVGVSLEPGEIDTFETHSAEYIGSGIFE